LRASTKYSLPTLQTSRHPTATAPCPTNQLPSLHPPVTNLLVHWDSVIQKSIWTLKSWDFYA